VKNVKKFKSYKIPWLLSDIALYPLPFQMEYLLRERTIEGEHVGMADEPGMGLGEITLMTQGNDSEMH